MQVAAYFHEVRQVAGGGLSLGVILAVAERRRFQIWGVSESLFDLCASLSFCTGVIV
jgi:hypothetical protein